MLEGPVYDLTGPEGAPLLVLLGSLGTTRSVWDRQMEALRPWFRTLRVEHPGHGGAPVPPGPATVEAMGRRVLALVDNLGEQAFHLAGLSLGGLVGMWLAANHPARVTRLALCFTTARFEPPEGYSQRAEAARAGGTAPFAAAAISRWFTTNFPTSHPEVAGEYRAMLAGVDAEGYAYCCEAIAGADLRGDLGRIEAPTLVLGAAGDPVVTPGRAAATMQAVPGAALCILPGGAHLANVELPGPFNGALLAHLAGSPEVRGERERRAVLGDAHVDRASAASSAVGNAFQGLLAKWPWGEIWARPGLDRRTRRLLTIAVLAALGRHEELSLHVRAALGDGVSEETLGEVLLHCSVYAGVPAANAAIAVAERVLRESSAASRTV
ncbi:MAG: alpha/beta fold hydrolase [Acidimicrobiales bacterium]